MHTERGLQVFFECNVVTSCLTISAGCCFWQERLWDVFRASDPRVPKNLESIRLAFRICEIYGHQLLPDRGRLAGNLKDLLVVRPTNALVCIFWQLA